MGNTEMSTLATLNRARKAAEAVLDDYGWGRRPEWDTPECRQAYDDRDEAMKAIAAYDNGRGTVQARFDRFWSYVNAERLALLNPELADMARWKRKGRMAQVAELV